jgi:DNA-binding CsgD family transcriptional regulator
VDPRIGDLTMREIAVLALLRDGLPDKLIAFALGISIMTVRFHLDNASAKIGTKSRVESAIWTDRNFWPPGFLQRFINPMVSGGFANRIGSGELKQ